MATPKTDRLSDEKPLDPRDAQAVGAFLEALRLGPMTPDGAALWARTTKEGRALMKALRRYDVA